jgi:hypothetical protein
MDGPGSCYFGLFIAPIFRAVQSGSLERKKGFFFEKKKQKTFFKRGPRGFAVAGSK